MARPAAGDQGGGVRAGAAAAAAASSSNITDEIGKNVDQLIDAKLMVISYFVEHPELLNELFLIMGRKELRFMQNFGFYFGLPMGFVLFGILQVFPHWWVLPVGGVIIGWMVNWLGITMIFEPVHRAVVPVAAGADDQAPGRGHRDVRADGRRQGDHAAEHRQRADDRPAQRPHPAAARGLAAPGRRQRRRAGPRRRAGGDRRARSTTRSASSVATEATGFAPIAFNDAEFSKQQSGKIYRSSPPR